VCCQEWVDRKNRDVIVPRQARDQRSTSILIAGDVLTPLFVIYLRTIDDPVREEGWWDEQNFMIRSNDTANFAHRALTECLATVILPYFNTTTKTMNLQNFPAVFVSDICRSHIDEKKQAISCPAKREINLNSSEFVPVISGVVPFTALMREKGERSVDRPA
jgi:hypothetical protein